MRIGIHDLPKPFEDHRGVVILHGREFRVVDLDTGEPVEDLAAMLWGPGSLLTHPLQGEDGGLLTPEHVDEDTDYLVLVIPCSRARRL